MTVGTDDDCDGDGDEERCKVTPINYNIIIPVLRTLIILKNMTSISNERIEKCDKFIYAFHKSKLF